MIGCEPIMYQLRTDFSLILENGQEHIGSESKKYLKWPGPCLRTGIVFMIWRVCYPDIMSAILCYSCVSELLKISAISYQSLKACMPDNFALCHSNCGNTSISIALVYLFSRLQGTILELSPEDLYQFRTLQMADQLKLAGGARQPL